MLVLLFTVSSVACPASTLATTCIVAATIVAVSLYSVVASVDRVECLHLQLGLQKL